MKLPGGVLKPNHTYFKANSRSFIQLPGSIDVTWTGSIYLPGEFREKNLCGACSVGRARWYQSDSSVMRVLSTQELMPVPSPWQELAPILQMRQVV